MAPTVLPLSPLTWDGLARHTERVMHELACTAWALADSLREGDEVSTYYRKHIIELADERDAISARYEVSA